MLKRLTSLRRVCKAGLTKEIFLSEKRFRNRHVIGAGSYGEVHKAFDCDRGYDVAIKIINLSLVNKNERDIWPLLKHPNITPLLEYISIEETKDAIFIMPHQFRALNRVVVDEFFFREKWFLSYLKKWLLEILAGLEYLHGKNLSHTDIKADNVLISHSHTAMLCDFTFLNETTELLERDNFGLPLIYCPPEACSSSGDGLEVNGKSFDMWSFGMMTFEVLTRFSVLNTISLTYEWKYDIYPTLKRLLQEQTFKSLLRKTLPASNIQEKEAILALDFCYSFLQSDPLKRMGASDAKKHAFLGMGSCHGPGPDSLWIDPTKKKTVFNFASGDAGTSYDPEREDEVHPQKNPELAALDLLIEADLKAIRNNKDLPCFEHHVGPPKDLSSDECKVDLIKCSSSSSDRDASIQDATNKLESKPKKWRNNILRGIRKKFSIFKKFGVLLEM